MSELDELFAGVATMKDGTTRIKSGTLRECAEWADRMLKEGIQQIELRKVER